MRLLLILILSFATVFSQEKSKKELKEEKKQERQKEIATLIDSVAYEFVGDIAYPQSGKSINLTTNTNYLRIKNDSIFSEMPFFGRAYAGVPYGGGAGLSFKGKMQNYTIEKKKKNYEMKCTVKTSEDNFVMNMTIYFEGNAYLSIHSNNRSPISYTGKISKSEK